MFFLLDKVAKQPRFTHEDHGASLFQKSELRSLVMKVLVVDDSGVMRKIIIRALNAVGVTDTVEAADGQEAIDAFSANEFDMVLTDWNMPVKNGLEFLTELRATGSTVPVIMVTTESQKGQVVAAIQAGVTDYLTKPFEQEQLRAKLDKYVPA